MKFMDWFDEAQDFFDTQRWQEKVKNESKYDPSNDYIFNKFWAPIDEDED